MALVRCLDPLSNVSNFLNIGNFSEPSGTTNVVTASKKKKKPKKKPKQTGDRPVPPRDPRQWSGSQPVSSGDAGHYNGHQYNSRYIHPSDGETNLKWNQPEVSRNYDGRNNSHYRTFGSAPRVPPSTFNNQGNRSVDRISFIPRQVEMKTERVRKPPVMPELRPKLLDVGSLKKGMVTSVNKHNLMIQLVEDIPNIDIISEQLKGYLAEHRSKVKRPRPGFLCAVEIDGRWLRASVIGYYEMQLVDIGELLVYANRSGNLLYDLYFIDHWPDLNKWPEMAAAISIESFTRGTKGFLTRHQCLELRHKLVNKPFIFDVVSSNNGQFSVQLIPFQVLDGEEYVTHKLVTEIPEVKLPSSGLTVLNWVGKNSDGIYFGQVENGGPVLIELSKMGEIYQEEPKLRINAVEMKRGQFVVWRTKSKGSDRYRRMVITGESDDGVFYEGRSIDTGEVMKLRIADSFKMIKPFDTFPCQSASFKLADELPEPQLQGKTKSLKVYFDSKDENGVLIVKRYEIVGNAVESRAFVAHQCVEEDWDESEKKEPVIDHRSSSAASSSACKMSTIYEASNESFADHELECSQETLPSINQEDDFEPSFYEVDDEKRNYPTDQLEDFGNEIAEMVAQQDVKFVLESIVSQLVHGETKQAGLLEGTLVDLALPVAPPFQVLVDIGSLPTASIDLMDMELNEAPRSRSNSNFDILTGNENLELNDSAAVINERGDLIDCSN